MKPYSFEVRKHRNLEERVTAARKLVELFSLPPQCQLVADCMDNNANVAYGVSYERVCIVQKKKIAYLGGKGPFYYNLKDVQRWLEQSYGKRGFWLNFCTLEAANNQRAKPRGEHVLGKRHETETLVAARHRLSERNGRIGTTEALFTDCLDLGKHAVGDAVDERFRGFYLAGEADRGQNGSQQAGGGQEDREQAGPTGKEDRAVALYSDNAVQGCQRNSSHAPSQCLWAPALAFTALSCCPQLPLQLSFVQFCDSCGSLWSSIGNE
ncbi:hypothetical protein SRHO_G00138720 [Serrasalmus rhombeus]